MDFSLPTSMQQYEDIAERVQLITQFNLLMGNPGREVASIQRDFIGAKMSIDDLVSLIRLYEHVIDGSKKH